MAKYHITKKGNPGVCRAEAGNCPFGSENEHFATAREAHDAYQAKMGKETVKKPLKKTPAKKLSRRESYLKKFTDLSAEKAKLQKDLKELNKSMTQLEHKKNFHERELAEVRQQFRDAKTPEAKAKAKELAKIVQDKLNPVQAQFKPLASKRDNLSMRLLKVDEKLGPVAKVVHNEKLGLPDQKPAKKASSKPASNASAVASSEFSWHSDTNTFNQEISSLPGQRLPEFIQSAKTGDVVKLELEEEVKDNENDVLYWKLKPVDANQSWRVQVFND